MILVDTSVWIDHLRHNDAKLVQLLNENAVLAHPFVTGELALGSLQNRDAILSTLQNMAQAPVATEYEILRFIEQNALYRLGIGYVDAHLLASVRLAPGTKLWTRDKRMLVASTRLGLSGDIDGISH